MRQRLFHRSTTKPSLVARSFYRYPVSVNPGCLLARGLRLILALGLSSSFSTFAAERSIHLRNETIVPSRQTPSARATANASSAGLFLIQFTNRFEPHWRDLLQAEKVELVRYVPDDAFVVSIRGAGLGKIRSLPFVRWIGPYRAEHKIHSSLSRASQQNVVHVRALLSAGASADEKNGARQILQSLTRESTSRFGVIWDGALNPAQLRAFAESPAVLWIEPAPKPKLVDEIAAKIVGGNDGTNGTFTLTQQAGFDGAGVAVAVADSGLNTGTKAGMHPDLAGRVDAFFFYGTNLVNAADEHSHGTHVTGIIAGNGATGEVDENGFLYGLGVASGAHIVAQRIFDGAGNYEPPPSYEVLTHDAVRAGAVIGSNSWGDDTQGRYDLSAAEFDGLVRDADAGTPGDQPYILEFSAGNAGPGLQTVGSPAVAKNVIATGASENDRTEFIIYSDGIDVMADFSSRGPCEDGRIKPDVVAPGTWIASARSALANDDNAWAPISDYYLYQGGTSQAGPQVSGAAAVFVQYYRSNFSGSTPSPAMVKAALINSAVDMDNGFGTDFVPNNDEGWGRVDLTQIIGSPRRYEYVDQSQPLTNSQIYERKVLVASALEPLKITLTYTDVPGFPAAIPALVNDLDLEVIDPDGRVYHGNQFDGGESVAGAPAFDSLNNVEAVHLFSPLPGQYVVRVRAHNVVEDARRDTPAIDQDFALVVSADLPLPGHGVVFLDRPAYRAADVIKITLIDFDLSAQSTASVLLRSATENSGEQIVLRAASSGIFTGTVATATGTAASDGRLQISHGDSIEALYQDASPPGTRTALAVADLFPPVITNVSATNRFGRIVVSWQTDEPSTSIVRYGTNALSLSVTNLRLTTSHSMVLDNVAEGALYRLFVISSDAAGNISSNNNGGAFYTFVRVPSATALLVDSYFYDDGLEQDPPIPASTYTDALNQTGVSYEVWDVNQIGRSPTAQEMGGFRVVIWRVNDSFWSSGSPTNNLNAAQQNTIAAYLAQGGSFFMASMEIITRIGAGNSFLPNILKVHSFAEDVGVPSVDGVDNDPVSSGMSMSLDYSAYPDLSFIGGSQDLSDTIIPVSSASPIFFESASSQVAGLRFPRTGQDSTNRVVFLPFPFDAVSAGDADPNNRASLMRKILSFLAPGVNGLGTIALDQSEYTLSAQMIIEVADSDLAGQGQASARVFSTTDTNGQSVVLSETVRRGLFRGYVTLVSQTNPPAAGDLRARHGDQVQAEYLDASSGRLIRAVASIDTQPPGISGVTVAPEYGEATVSWQTTEAADALVQFGESTFLGRTAYNPAFGESHELTLTGLLPDQVYYFQVVSRDPAGNATTDDNGGRLYSFRTLRPIRPPFTDNLENNSATNWTVIDGEETQTSWTLGPPANGRETSAHSPSNAWGCNLSGNTIDAAQTFLISPAFELVGGNRATLRFWQSYDFPYLSGDIGEIAQLYISTNSGKGWILLSDYTDSNGGWEEEQIDLSPYLGQVVRLGWYYEMLSFEMHSRPGWLIDDVSLSMSTVASGQIQITNNLAQATFSLTGPVSRTGSGWNTLVSNAPLGQYVVTFGPVPYYQTPSPQSNTLSAGQTLVFSGNYSLIDGNTNGIADPWEQQYFGSVAPDRTRTTDSDGDGVSDYAEFIAGTNPTNAASYFSIASETRLADGRLRLNWPSVPNRAYQVQGSADAIAWFPVVNWFIASGTNTSVTLPAAAPGGAYLFRLEVRP